jgi:hypothetical protein
MSRPKMRHSDGRLRDKDGLQSVAPTLSLPVRIVALMGMRSGSAAHGLELNLLGVATLSLGWCVYFLAAVCQILGVKFAATMGGAHQ